MQMNAFIDGNGVLVSYGFAASDAPGTTLVPVPLTFSEPIGQVRYQDGAWQPYVPPLSWASYQSQAQVLLADSDRVVLRCYSAGVAVSAAWQSYRQALRTIVGASTGDPTQALPTKPAYPVGT